LFAICNSNIAVSSLPSEPAEASPGPHLKEDDEIRKMAEAIMDKVVDQLLNESAEIVLKED
jgi:DNA topoisomerase VI subunit B